jgi:cytochrome c oxidase accessory protein FixG
MDGPTLDKLAILDDHGRRMKIHPADVDGRFQRAKPFVRWGLIGLFVALPWISVGGHPAVLLDLPMRRAYLFGHVFVPSDMPFLFFGLTAIAWTLIMASTLFGRVWCGWACPQTVYLEGVYRRIERKIEGNGAQRLAFDTAPWTSQKIAKKVLKWSLWLLSSFLIAHIFLSYFVSIPRVVDMVLDDPREHWEAFLVAAFATGLVHFNFAWFREQTCLIICPYGRFQSALQDRDSIVIGYDKKRGEPRGKATEPGHGDCVDCRKCVTVCPTGIDIRNGLQMECIGCAACIDACDDVMKKLHRAPGLIRYDSERGLAGEGRRVLRPRVYFYLAAGVVGLAVLLAFALTRTPIVARVVRPAGVPFGLLDDVVQNQAMIHVENRSSGDRNLDLVVDAPDDVMLLTPQRHVSLPPGGKHDFQVIVRVPRKGFTIRHIPFTVRDDEDKREVTVTLDVLGPVGVP